MANFEDFVLLAFLERSMDMELVCVCGYGCLPGHPEPGTWYGDFLDLLLLLLLSV